MPKVILTKTEILNETARNLTATVANVKGINAFAKAMGFGKNSYYNRLKCPEKFTLGEMRRLYRTGKLTDDEFLLMIRTDDEKNSDPTLKWRR